MSLSLCPGVRWLRVDDGIVIFAPRSRRFVDLNDTAAIVWDEALHSQWSSDRVVLHLVENYALGSAEAAEIVDAFVADLVVNGIVIHE